MSKSIPVIILTAVLLIIALFGIIQYNDAQKKKSEFNLLKKDLTEVESILDSTKKEYEKTTFEKNQLQEQNIVLQDSIRKLNNIIVQLRDIILKKDQIIKDYQDRIDSKTYAYQKLKEEIADLYQKDRVSMSKVAKLEKEKAALKKQIESIAKKQEKTLAEKGMTTEEMLDYQASKAAFEKVKDITQNTKIRYKRVEPRRSRHGREITRIDGNSNSWNFTLIDFKLEHRDVSSIVDEEFIVKIRDESNNKNMVYFSENPNFPSDYVDGVPFKFDGNLVETVFHNAQKKKGKKYAVNVYLIKDNGEYLLENSPISIFEEPTMALKK